jgi:hypothetical protein
MSWFFMSITLAVLMAVMDVDPSTEDPRALCRLARPRGRKWMRVVRVMCVGAGGGGRGCRAA